MRPLAKGLLLAAAACVATASFAQSRPGTLPPKATAHPDLWPHAASPAAITDAATEKRIDALLRKMTVEQKVGQVVQGDISTITPEDLAKYPLGSILAGGNSGPRGNERGSAADWDRLVQAFRDASMKPAANGIAIPILFGVDAVHGHNNIPGATVFPHNVGLGAAHDPALIRRIGEVTAAEIAGSGIEWTFAPTLAVPQNGRWGRAYEGYSSDPAIVASYAGEMVLGLQGRLEPGKPLATDKAAATAKHFLADGGTFDGKDQGDAKISEKELIAIHAAGYPKAIDAGALTVMASFSSWNGVKNHGNKTLLTGALKGAMGFQGFVVGDWNAHGQIPGCTVTDCPQALNAGLDMYMAPDSWKGLFESLVKQVRAGTVPMQRLDDAVRRILRVKAKLGLLDTPLPVRRDYAAIGAPEHLAVAREAVAKSLVLLKNNGSVLPIRPGARVLVAGEAANSMAKQSGGWTISWQGTDVTASDFPNGRTIWSGLWEAVREAGGAATYSADGSWVEKPDVAVVVFGESPYAEFQGDVATLDYQPGDATDLALLRKLKDAGIPVVSVFLSGRPMFTGPEINASDAFVAAWLPGSQGQGVADVLVAGRDGKPKRDFTGRLSFPWPADAHAPVTKPLFPLGYGLDYGKPVTLGPVAEDPGMDVAASVNVETWFAAGRARAPWSLAVADASGQRRVESAPTASGNGAVTARSVDVAAQEDGKQIVWTAPGALVIEGQVADASRQLNNAFALRLDVRVDALGSGPVTMAVAGVPVALRDALAALPAGKPASLRVPMRCFADRGADFAKLAQALRISGDAGLSLTLLGVRLEPVGDNPPCLPQP